MSTYIDNRGQVQTITAAVTAAGAEWPTDLQAALDAADIVADITPIGAQDAVGKAYLAAVLAGKTPATDKATQLALTEYQLAQVVTSGLLAQEASRRRAEALTTHAPEIIEQLRHIVAESDQVLQAAREVFPHLDVRDPGQIRAATPPHAAAWAKGRDAATRVGQAVAAWIALGQSTGLIVDPRRRALILADLTADELDALGHHPEILAALHAGHPLDMATPEVYTARIETVVTEQAEAPTRRAAEAEKARRQNYLTGARI